ncbi:DNA-directed RNA polymerase subunit alpha C-terminal domain-containing protein [Candidatus Uabimicrobium sp. HlEnr_7]|uniref:DNA-directed RNA polymerase subunit alpha C-terminal domain-containing protein n=1 Tax=Candidatus Uabimicrobium helgolandensis TaxID=3095367 RepID=UPI0035576689
MRKDTSHFEKTDITWILSEEKNKEILKKHGKKAHAQALKGKQLFLDSDFSGAYTEFKKLANSHEEETVFTLAATSSAVESQKAKEFKDWKKKLAPHYQWYFEGVMSDRSGDSKHAIVCYEKSSRENENFTPTLYRLAYYCDLYGDESTAIKLYEKCLPLRPLHTNILMNLGILYEDLGQYDKATECYEKILDRYPENVRAKLYLKDARSSMTMYVDEEKEKLKDQRNEILSTPITDFELSVRSRNCLNKMKIKSLGDLIKKSEAELLSYKNFGETSLAEIKEILGKKGLSLGMESDKFLEPKKKDIKPFALIKDNKDESLLSKSIATLELSVRSRKCLSKVGVKSINDLIGHSEQELLSCKNFGQTSMQEIKKKLNDMGLALKS